jgi:hypothetical protein
MAAPKQSEWRGYRLTLAPAIVEVGLERVREARGLLRRRVVVEERLLDRRFRLRDELAWSRYQALLEQAARHIGDGTFGAYVDIDPLAEGIRVRLVRRTLGEQELAVAISDERRFAAEEISASAEYAEQLRAVAREENDAFWAAARDAAERARSAREDAHRRARDVAELSEILESEGSSG